MAGPGRRAPSRNIIERHPLTPHPATAAEAHTTDQAAPHRRLRRLNVVVGTAHAAQAAAMVALANDTSLTVTAWFASGPPGQPPDPSGIDELFSYPLAIGVALFSALSAFFHFLVASPWGVARYQRELDAERNRYRWTATCSTTPAAPSPWSVRSTTNNTGPSSSVSTAASRQRAL